MTFGGHHPHLPATLPRPCAGPARRGSGGAFTLAALLFLGVSLSAWCQLMGRPITEPELRTSLGQALDNGDWTAYRTALQKAVLALFENGRKYGVRDAGTVVGDDVMGLVIAQANVIDRATPEVLQRLTQEQRDRDFCRWFLASRGVVEDFLEAVKPEDDVAAVLGVWRLLWNRYPDSRDTYRNLALAFALVFDKPVTTRSREAIDPAARFAFFVESDRKQRLEVDLEDLPAWELVWVVDAPVPESELVWAQQNAKYSRRNWDRAYSDVPYRMDKVTKGNSIYSSYTLAEILKKGGICSDRGYYAAITAKANGIPAMAIGGVGERGGHCWFGYKVSDEDWNMEAGRFEGDRYATGYSRDPQTGVTVKEQSLYLLADRDRRSSKYRKVSRLMWLGAVLSAADQEDKAGPVYDQIVAETLRHVDAWDAVVAHLRQAKAPDAKWQQVLGTMRTTFRRYPDMVARVDDLEYERNAAAKGVESAARTLGRQLSKMARKSDDRTDLVLEQIVQQAAALEKDNKIAAADEVFRDALRLRGKEMVAFRELATRYVAMAKRHDRLHDAVAYVGSKFKSHFDEPRADAFAMNAYAELLDTMAGFYEADGQDSPAKRCRKNAERIRSEASRSFR